MIDEKRRYTTIVFMSSLLLAIIICFIEFDQGPKLFLLILLLIIQACASLWYSLSYIPFARTQAVSCMKGAFGMNDDSTWNHTYRSIKHKIMRIFYSLLRTSSQVGVMEKGWNQWRRKILLREKNYVILNALVWKNLLALIFIMEVKVRNLDLSAT